MKFAFWYHCRFSGGKNVDTGASIDPKVGERMFRHQTDLISQSGLDLYAQKIFVGVNGIGVPHARMMGFHCETEIIQNGENAESLLPTLSKLQEWLPGHEGWAVGFAHMKGVTHPGNRMIQGWAECLNRHTITHWRENVRDLGSGQYDACGCHWTHNSPNDQNAGNWGENSYFAGGFFWATVDYLLTLPKIPSKPVCRHDWFKGELWLGCGKPRIKDCHPVPCTIHA